MCARHACVARETDGTAVVWGNSRYRVDESGADLTNVVDAMCGVYACVTRKTDGTAVV